MRLVAKRGRDLILNNERVSCVSMCEWEYETANGRYESSYWHAHACGGEEDYVWLQSTGWSGGGVVQNIKRSVNYSDFSVGIKTFII